MSAVHLLVYPLHDWPLLKLNYETAKHIFLPVAQQLTKLGNGLNTAKTFRFSVAKISDKLKQASIPATKKEQ